MFVSYLPMACLNDLATCKSDGSLGWCCSKFCMQALNEPAGFCQITTPTTSLPPNLTSSTTRKSRECLEGNAQCKSDGSIGSCCSNYCNQLKDEPYGICIGSSKPAGVPEACIKDGQDCRPDGSLGWCCNKYCDVLKPQVQGVCKSLTTNVDSSDNHTWVIYTCTGLAAFTVIILGFIWLYWRQRKLEEGLSEREAKQFYEGDPELLQINGYAHERTDNMPYNKELEIAESDFSIEWENPLGEGCYGLVLRGKIKTVLNVAAKTLRTNQAASNGNHLRALLCEIKILQYIGKHENVVSMVGCHTSKLRNDQLNVFKWRLGVFYSGKVFLFLEFCPLGSLEKFLRAHKQDFLSKALRPHSYVNLAMPGQSLEASRTATTSFANDMSLSDFLNWSMQITNAMVYLAEKKVIHADIATRNILLLRKDCAKLTDFGLSRRLYEYGNYVKKNQEPLPWRWMAIESLQQMTFSHKSDVWSLGITIWEIYSLGDVPYPGLSWTTEFMRNLENNLRPEKPQSAHEKIYEIIYDCWKSLPEARPTFREIYTRLYEYKHYIESGGV